MKRVISFLLAVVMIFSCAALAGCKKDEVAELTLEEKLKISHEHRNRFRDDENTPYSEDTEEIIENLPFTDTIEVSSMFFYKNEPFEANICYTVKEGATLDEMEFKKNAYFLLSLVDELYLVSFQPEGTGDRERIYFNKDNSYEVIGEDMYPHTESYDEFVEIYEKIANIK